MVPPNLVGEAAGSNNLEDTKELKNRLEGPIKESGILESSSSFGRLVAGEISEDITSVVGLIDETARQVSSERSAASGRCLRDISC